MEKFSRAVAITAKWKESDANTISRKDIKTLKKKAPSFGALDEGSGRKLYAYLKKGERLRKLVLPVCDGDFNEEGKRVLSEIENAGFSLIVLHRPSSEPKLAL